eukprot:GEMP01065036.1.p1 GENE.GEMP01065036.1~~GEMP01065036.1.p1  ORF type:complete len:319 (+),score=92.32 GEMP01065036.1:209-1165(+)
MSRQGKTWGVKNGWGAKDAEWDTGNSWDKTDKSDWGIGNTNGYHVDAHDPMAQSVALVKKYITKVINGKWDVSTCELLEFSVDNSLKRPKHARNRLQRNLVAEIKAGLEKYKDTLETKQDDAQRLYEQFQEDCDTADEHLEALTSEIKEIEAQKIGAEETVQREYELMMALKGKEDEAQDEVHAVQQKTKELNAQVARTAYVYEREFLCMKKDYRTHGRVEKITQQLEKLGAEEALVKCIDVSLQLAERGDLAMAAIALAEKVFAEKLEESKPVQQNAGRNQRNFGRQDAEKGEMRAMHFFSLCLPQGPADRAGSGRG